MINAKVRAFEADYTSYLENEISEFLKTIDVRQIIKTDFSSAGKDSSYRHSAIIYYVEINDVRDAKIENILEIK